MRSWKLATVLLLVTFPLAAHGETCSCSSSNCSTSITCTAGCYSICGITCTSGCSGGGSGNGPRHPSLLSTVPATVSLSEFEKGPEAISRSLSDQLGVDVIFASADTSLTLDVKNMPTEALLEALAEHGIVGIYQEAAEGEASRSRGYVTLLARGAGSAVLSPALSAMAGRQVNFQPFGDGPLVIEAKNVPLHQLFDILAAHGSLQIADQ